MVALFIFSNIAHSIRTCDIMQPMNIWYYLALLFILASLFSPPITGSVCGAMYLLFTVVLHSVNPIISKDNISFLIYCSVKEVECKLAASVGVIQRGFISTCCGIAGAWEEAPCHETWNGRPLKSKEGFDENFKVRVSGTFDIVSK